MVEYGNHKFDLVLDFQGHSKVKLIGKQQKKLRPDDLALITWNFQNGGSKMAKVTCGHVMTLEVKVKFKNYHHLTLWKR